MPYVLANQCGGYHTYEIFANGSSCGIENIGISQFAQMNLATSVINPTCTQQGSATVNITGVGASAISTYCNSTPQYNNYTTIDSGFNGIMPPLYYKSPSKKTYITLPKINWTYNIIIGIYNKIYCFNSRIISRFCKKALF